MSNVMDCGMLRGRPFGGVLTLINNRLRSVCETVHCSERYAIVRVANYLLVNLYLPCTGVTDRTHICEEILLNV